MDRKALFNRQRLTSALEPGYGARKFSEARSFYHAVNKPLVISGSILVIGALLVQLLPPVIRSSNVFNGAVTACLALYSLIGFLFLRNSFRVTFPILVLGLIQIWIVATIFLSPQVFGLELKLGRNIWWPSFVMMPYFAAFILVALDQRWRERLLSFLLIICVFTALVGILQFLKFPGTQTLSNWYVDLEDLKTFGLEKRSHGLSTHPFHLSAQCIMGLGIVAGNLLFRKLKPVEIFYYAVLSAGLIVAQARTFYIAWAIVTLVTMGLLLWRSKPQFFAILGLISVVLIGLIVAFPEQLSYGLSGKNTISEGRMQQWNRADELSSLYPLTGIGPKETVFGSGKDFSGSGRWWTLYTESGYRMSRVSGGYIGLGLMILMVISCSWLALRVTIQKNADEVRRRAAFAGTYFMFAMAIGLYITNIVENELMTYYGLVLAALVSPQIGEIWKTRKRRNIRTLKRLTVNRETQGGDAGILPEPIRP